MFFFGFKNSCRPTRTAHYLLIRFDGIISPQQHNSKACSSSRSPGPPPCVSPRGNQPPDTCCCSSSSSSLSSASYWDDFHSCATTALADCQEGATDLWEKLKKQSRNLDFRESLFELCAGGGNGAPRSGVPRALTLLLTACSALVTWLAF